MIYTAFQALYFQVYANADLISTQSLGSVRKKRERGKKMRKKNKQTEGKDGKYKQTTFIGKEIKVVVVVLVGRGREEVEWGIQEER